MTTVKDEDVVLVLDCGSTNLKAIAINSKGRVLSQESFTNSSVPQKDGKQGWLIWDLDEIWLSLTKGAKKVSKQVGPENIKAVTTITWGADGAPVRKDGTPTYPPISWQCPRTEETAKKIRGEMPAWYIFRITGYQPIAFNTLFKLIWLKENVPKALEDAYTWLMMPGLITYKLTSKFYIEPTSASTMMIMDLKNRDWSQTMLDLTGIAPSFFPVWSEPGQIVGYVTDQAEEQCGVPAGVPVVAGGHDTQFALFGSGARMDEALLSSGTWEILGVRTRNYNPSRAAFEGGMIIEADVQPGLWNPQLLMMGSGVLEWVLDKIYPKLGNQKYQVMIDEAKKVPVGSDGITFIPSFVKETGPTKQYETMGTILGLTLRTSCGQIVRSTLEGLSFQLRQALGILTKETDVSVKGIRIVGGGSRNLLWNQIRADVTGLPVIVSEQKEYAALGAALAAFIGIDQFKSVEEGHKCFHSKQEVFTPDADRVKLYNGFFTRYLKSLESLKNFYQSS